MREEGQSSSYEGLLLLLDDQADAYRAHRQHVVGLEVEVLVKTRVIRARRIVRRRMCHTIQSRDCFGAGQAKVDLMIAYH